MTVAPGPLIRALVGPSLARHMGRWYRGIFVNLQKEARAIASALPQGAHVVDVGGGDGEPLNHLLDIRPDLRVTTLDPGPVVGQWLRPAFSSRVICRPSTTLGDYLADDPADIDALLIADVMHHIPESRRAEFLMTVSELLIRFPGLRLIVKDVEPGNWRASLGYLSDRYITGDRTVSPVTRTELIRLFESSLGPLRYQDTNLFAVDPPNYALAFCR